MLNRIYAREEAVLLGFLRWRCGVVCGSISAQNLWFHWKKTILIINAIRVHARKRCLLMIKGVSLRREVDSGFVDLFKHVFM